MVDLSAAPFHLDGAAQDWVASQLSTLSTRDKIGQLFCLLAVPATREQIDSDLVIAAPGGYMRRPAPREDILALNRYLQSRMPIPALIAANIESGAEGLALDGTSYGSPLQVAATDDPRHATQMGVVAGREARALGCRWAFSPIIDIQVNFRNPMVLTRGFGSDPERVARMGSSFVSGVQSEGVAAAIKHWPGDGVDDRDQHLVTAVNSLTVDEWEATFGAVYRTAIDAGALSLMAGHIALPEYSRRLRPGIADEDILPASLSKEITTDLLRGQLGFQGLVVTDASTMAGMQLPMPRSELVPLAIAAGCDMFLFSPDYAEDFEYLSEGVRSGIVSAERLDEAVTRVLALKAAVGLHLSTELDDLVPDDLEDTDTSRHREWARASADAAITLVKNLEPGILPLNPADRPRLLVYSLRGRDATMAAPNRMCALLDEAGFSVHLFDPAPTEDNGALIVGKDGGIIGRELREGFDAVIYLADVWPYSNVPAARLEWAYKTAANVPKYVTEVPTIFVSLGSPFHLQDVPRVRTFINAYAHNEQTIDAVVDKLVGRSPFAGVSPVDPFCGYWDARL